MSIKNLSLRPNDNLGFYLVNGQRYESKIHACIVGTRLGKHPTWHFHDDVWNQIDWTIEPEIDIQELYRQRARQIREQYDYVIINYSGGSDSQTAVNAFLQSDSFIDEIQTVWQSASPVLLDPTVTAPNNVEAEWYFTTRHGINEILNQSPKTKVTYIDVSKDIIDAFNEDSDGSWVEHIADRPSPRHVCGWNQTWFDDQIRLLDRGKRTAILFGIDKPRVCIKDGKFHVYFIDSLFNQTRSATRSEYDNIDYVYFYWSAEFPKILVKQAHLIMQWFNANPRLKPILQWPMHNITYRHTYESVIRSIIYPEWNMNTWQAEKITKNVYTEWSNWFHIGMKNTRAYHNWTKGLDYIQAHIDPKYLVYNQGLFDGFVGFINGHFCLETP